MEKQAKNRLETEGVEGFWIWDNVHAPRPMAPISGDTITQHLASGFTRAMQEFGGPAAMQSRQINYYPYHRMSFMPPQGETEEERSARYQRTLTDVVPRIGELWEEEWLPFILPPLERALGIDYAALSDSGLWDVLTEQLQDSSDRWWIHGKLNYVLVAASQFADFYNAEFHPDNDVEAYEVLQGFDTLSLEQGRGLWHLSRLVKENPVLSQCFADTAIEALPSRLGESEDGQGFLRELGHYLDRFGWRSDAIYDVANRTWREDPSIPLGLIKGYLAMGPEGDPDLEHQRSIDRRSELLQAARSRLEKDPDRLRYFNDLYESARHNLAVTENHNYYIDCMGVTVLRLPLLEIGRRLVERGRLPDAEDVFMLHLVELEQALLTGHDYRSAVSMRRDEMRRAAESVPPASVGAPEALDTSDPFAQAMLGKMMGLAGFEPSDDPGVLKGVAGSAGVVRGVARVVRSLAEASKLQPGDIMVCEMTTPPWTPLFGTIAGLVADTGGVLSHCAIVAREYRLPAVVGTQVGTQVIKDGMTITVDGTQGMVRIESGLSDAGDAEGGGAGKTQPQEPLTTVDGKWQLAWDTPMGHVEGVLDVTASGGKLTGTLLAQDTRQEIRDGKVKGETYSFKASAETPMGKLNLTFEGKVDGEQTSGAIKAMMMKLPFTGQRVRGPSA